MSASLRAAAVLVALVLAACAPVRLRESPAALAAQQAREARLQASTRWTIAAHIAVSDGQDGGSGELVWKQDGPRYDFTVHAPVTGKVWKLSGDAAGAALQGVEPQPLTDTDPQRLLRERLGWSVPLTELEAWVRGLRAPAAAAQVTYDAHDLPVVIVQSGWTVEYRDWYSDRDPPLPRKVFASRGSARVRMAIQSWTFDE